jgi:hypothetical protein
MPFARENLCDVAAELRELPDWRAIFCGEATPRIVALVVHPPT